MAKVKNISVKTEAELLKKYGESTTDRPTFYIPTQCLALNAHMGKGFVYGYNYELFGLESSGKSLLAMEAAKSTQSMGGVVLWVDAERAFTKEWFDKNKIETENKSQFRLLRASSIEKIADWLYDMGMYYRSILTKNEPILFVLDSIAALISEKKGEVYMEDSSADMGTKARVMSDFFSKRNPLINDLGIAAIFINQIKTKMNVSIYESSDTTPGGKSTAYYSAIRLCLVSGKAIRASKSEGKYKFDDKGKTTIGKILKIRFIKNKLYPPKLDGALESEIYFRDKMTGYHGINRYMGLKDILLEAGVIEEKAARYYFEDKMIAYGESAFDEFLASKENASIRKKILAEANIPTLSKAKALLLEHLETNYFPV